MSGYSSGYSGAYSTAADPTNLVAVVSGSTVSLSWNASTTQGVAEYHIYRRNTQTGTAFDPNNAANKIGIVLSNQTTYIDTVTAGSYDYQVFGFIGETHL